MSANEPGRSPVQVRVYLPIDDLQPQFAAYLGTPTRARGYPPKEGDHSLIVEVAPALAIERITDLALRSVPEIEPGILYVERQFGILEVHSSDRSHVELRRARDPRRHRRGAGPPAAPRILYHDVIEDITGPARGDHQPQPRRRRWCSRASRCSIYEMTPALFAAVAANEAEKAAPDVTLVICAFIGAAGRIYLSGPTASVIRARDAITARRGDRGPRPPQHH